jgi:DNA-binding SARP family transcriptional activator
VINIPGDLHVTVLGPFEVRVDGRVVGPPRESVKVNSLLLLLALNANRAMSKAELAGLLWERPPSSARNLIEKYVSTWRKDIGSERLATVGSKYRLTLDAGECDLLQAERDLELGRAAQARGDTESARTDFGRALARWTLRPADLDQLAVPPEESRRLLDLYLSTLEEWAFASLSSGAGDLSVAVRLDEAVRREPLRERLSELRMWALSRQGRQAEALECYEQLRRALDEGLGQSPGADVAAMHVRLLRQDPALLAVPASAAVPIRHLPPRNRRFSGRVAELGRLRASLEPVPEAAGPGPRALTVWGLVGMGKSALALEYAHRHADEFHVVWWVDAATPATIAAGLDALAERMGCEPAADHTTGLRRLWHELRGSGSWLLIFDDAGDPADLADSWPEPPNGTIIVTSMNPGWQRLADVMELGVLSADESLELLTKLHHAASGPVAPRIAHALGHLPLALAQAAAYMEQTGLGAEQYLLLFLRRRGQLLERGVPDDHAGTIAATWRLASAQLSTACPAATELIAVCAFLAPANIPLDLFRAGPGELPAELRAAVEDEVGLEDAIWYARRYSLISRDGDALAVHCLVQDVVIASMSDADRGAWRAMAVRLLAAYAPADPDARGEWGRWELVSPHVVSIAPSCRAADAVPAGAVLLFRRTARYLSRRALFDEALVLADIAVGLAEEAKLDDATTGMLLTELGVALQHCGRWKEALTAHERSVELLQRSGDPDDPAVARAVSELGTVITCHQGVSLWEPSELESAERRMLVSLDVLRRTLGRTDASVPRAMAAVAQIQQDRGELDSAQQLFEEAVAILAATCGEDHPEFGRNLDKLAYLLFLRGEHARSRKLHLRAYHTLAAVYGHDNVEVGWPLSNLSLVELALGEYDQALATQARAQAIFVRADPQSAAVQIAAWRIARIEMVRGRPRVAADILDEALGRLRGIVAGDHPDVRAVAADLAAARAMAGLMDDQGEPSDPAR